MLEASAKKIPAQAGIFLSAESADSPAVTQLAVDVAAIEAER
jgi:hypothetical protein